MSIENTHRVLCDILLIDPFFKSLKVAKQYEVILKEKQLRQIKAWYEIKKGDGTISA